MFLNNLCISVEGVWTTWDDWGACSGTCNTNTRTRSMLYNDNMPCTGTSSQTENCQSEGKFKFIYCSRPYLALTNLQLKGHGQPGEHLEIVQQHVALEINYRQEASQAIGHALVATQTLKHALVSTQRWAQQTIIPLLLIIEL